MALKDFVGRILGKPSAPAEAAATPAQDEVLGLLLKLMQKQLEGNPKEGNNQRLCKVALAEMILPKVLNPPPTTPGEKRDLVNHDAAKDWAFACAQLMGFLAGLSLQEDAIDGAVNQAAKAAKEAAHHTHGTISKTIEPAITGNPYKPKGPVAGASLSTKREAGKAEKASAAMLTQKESMIKDLETEAMIEDGKGNLAAAAALRTMAQRMVKEVEIERDLNKQGKSAA